MKSIAAGKFKPEKFYHNESKREIKGFLVDDIPNEKRDLVRPAFVEMSEDGAAKCVYFMALSNEGERFLIRKDFLTDSWRYSSDAIKKALASAK